MPLANEFVPATLTPEEKRFLKEHTQSFREALKSHEESVWFERFWMVYFDRFPIAGHIIDLDERDFHRRRWKRVSHRLFLGLKLLQDLPRMIGNQPPPAVAGMEL